MATKQGSSEDLLDVARVVLLVQGWVLVATTIEALVWSAAFPGATGLPVVMSGAASAALLFGRTRLRADRSWTRRLVYGVEGLILATLAIDTALAIAIIGAYPPAVSLLTRLFLPVAVILLLRHAARGAVVSIVGGGAVAQEGVS